jgi:hypothetical protein
MKRWTAALMVGSLGLALVGLPGSANAQARGYVLLGGGLGIPVGDYHKVELAKTGWLAQVAGGITAPSGVIGGRVNGTFMRNGFSDASGEHVRIIGAMGDVVVSPKMQGNIAPYLLGGLGFQNGKSSESGATGSTKFAWNAGAGVGFRAGSIGVFVEARFLSISTDVVKTNLIPISAGIRWGGH